jgi:hypothetical protein
MKGKFILYALLVTLISTLVSWSRLESGSRGAGSVWRSQTGGAGGGSLGSGGHK